MPCSALYTPLLIVDIHRQYYVKKGVTYTQTDTTFIKAQTILHIFQVIFP